jgi:uncharacterized protein YkwD
MRSHPLRPAPWSLFLVLALTAPACGGSDADGDLTAEEAAVLEYTNYARTDPQGFAVEFLAELEASGQDNGAYADLMARSPVPAVTIHAGLTRVAREHSRDMAESCGLQHDSCDGTTWDARLRSVYPGGSLGENAAMGYPTGLSVVIAWIVDQGVPNLGHRQNLLGADWEHLGIGQYGGSWWTQDFGAGGE